MAASEVEAGDVSSRMEGPKAKTTLSFRGHDAGNPSRDARNLRGA